MKEFLQSLKPKWYELAIFALMIVGLFGGLLFNSLITKGQL